MSHWEECCISLSRFVFYAGKDQGQKPLQPPEVPGSRKCLKKCHHDTVPIDDSDYRLLALPSQFLGCT